MLILLVPGVMNFVKKTLLWLLSIVVVIIVGGIFAWFKWFAGPTQPTVTEPRLQAAVIELNGDKTLPQFVAELEAMHVIKSEAVALSLIQHLGVERKIKRGLYVFKGKENVFEILSRLANGDYGYIPAKITIPEGYTVRKMADTYSERLVDIKPEDFIKAAEDYEGVLFPDTYFFYPYATSGPVVAAMLRNFENRMAPLKMDFEIAAGRGDIANSAASSTSATTSAAGANLSKYGPRTIMQVIIMASILEKEVQTDADKAMVADLFYRRMQEGMALQADSTLTYATGKTSAQLTTKDLRDKSPYNSYTNRGLPPTPISNPGLSSIKAALYPQKNNYVYFLSDNDGVTHFSVTFEEHKKAKEKYLN